MEILDTYGGSFVRECKEEGRDFLCTSRNSCHNLLLPPSPPPADRMEPTAERVGLTSLPGRRPSCEVLDLVGLGSRVIGAENLEPGLFSDPGLCRRRLTTAGRVEDD